MMKKFILVVVLMCLASTALAIQIEVGEDFWIRESNPGQPYDGDGVGVWSTSKGDRRYGLVEFDLSGLAGTTVTEAYLDLFSPVHGWSDYFTPIKQSAFVISGSVSGLDWATYMADKDAGKQALETLGAYDLVAADTDPAQQDQFMLSAASAADIALIQQAVDGDGILSLVLIADESGAYGRSWGDAELFGENAVFWINEVPEPATLTLLGLGGLALIRRRRS